MYHHVSVHGPLISLQPMPALCWLNFTNSETFNFRDLNSGRGNVTKLRRCENYNFEVLYLAEEASRKLRHANLLIRRIYFGRIKLLYAPSEHFH